MIMKKQVSPYQSGGQRTQLAGSDIHEMGWRANGNDPKTSLLNRLESIAITVSNVFVNGRCCMTSTSTLILLWTFMAITARAANYAIEELKKQNLDRGN